MAPAISGVAISGNQDISFGPSGYKGLIKDWYILGLSCFASIGGLLFGYDQGVISGVLVMNNFVRRFPRV